MMRVLKRGAAIFVWLGLVYFLARPIGPWWSTHQQGWAHARELNQRQRELPKEAVSDQRVPRTTSDDTAIRFSKIESDIDGLKHSAAMWGQNMDDDRRVTSTMRDAIVSDKEFVRSYFFQVLGLLLTIFVGASALIGLIVRLAVTARVKQNLQERVAEMKEAIQKEVASTIQQRVDEGIALTGARIYLSLAKAFWERYEPKLMSDLRTNIVPISQECLTDAKVASDWANRGLRVCGDPTFRRLLTSSITEWKQDAQLVEAELVNHCTYHETVVVLGTTVTTPGETRLSDLAARCYALAHSSYVAKDYNYLETAAFAWIHGRIGRRQDGVDLLKALISGSRPSKPADHEWRKARWTEYNNALQLDLPEPCLPGAAP